MSEMIERVAIAIDPLAWVIPDDDYPAERSRRSAKQYAAMSAAKRAIEAMGEPTDRMKDRGASVGPDTPSGQFGWSDAENVYSAMINAALK